MSMGVPRTRAHKFRVQIPALPLDPGEVTSLVFGFLLWKVGLLKEPATWGRCEDSGWQVEGLRAHQRSPGHHRWARRLLFHLRDDPMVSVHFPGEVTEVWQGLGLFTTDTCY